MNKIKIILVPYHLGKEKFKTSLGPEYLVKKGLTNLFIQPNIKIQKIRLTKPKETEIENIFRLNQELAWVIKKAVKQKYFPFILAGDCNSCLGTLAGIGTRDLGIIWFYAHGDFNTPDTTITGYFDGMPLAIVAGRCYQKEWSKIGGKSIAEEKILLVGVRDLDREEKILLSTSAVQVIPMENIRKYYPRKALLPILDRLQRKVNRIYLHIDIDSLDPIYTPGVDYPVSYGLTLGTISYLIDEIRKRFQVSATAITAFNPKKDKNDKTVESIFHIVKAAAA